MATRAARAKAKQNADHTARLMNLLKFPANKRCADCHAKGPRWASWNLGVWICIRCSGIHRSLGVHISKVRSVNLDTWAPEWVESMEKQGNDVAAQIWEYHLPKDFNRPADNNAAMEQFIRDKYERCRYKRKATDPPLDATPASAPAPAATQQKKPAKVATPPAAFANFANFDNPSTSASSSNGNTDILGLFGDTPASASATTPAAANDDPFSAFTSAPSTPNSAPATSSAPTASTAPPPKSKSTSDDILALFDQPASSQVAPAMQNNPFGGMMMQQQQQQPTGMMPGMMQQQPGMMMGQQGMMQQQQQQPMMGQGMMQQSGFGGFPQQGMMQQQPQQQAFNPFGNMQQGMAAMNLNGGQAVQQNNGNIWQ